MLTFLAAIAVLASTLTPVFAVLSRLQRAPAAPASRRRRANPWPVAPVAATGPRLFDLAHELEAGRC